MSDRGMTRREFSKGMLAAGAVTMTARQAVAVPSANERITVASIGVRNRGWQDAKNFIQHGPFQVKALCDPDPAMYERAIRQISEGIPDLSKRPDYVKDFRRVLDDKDIDAVIVATPDHWHALVTCRALDAGKHVFLEKPASFNIDDGKAMVAAQKEHPKLALAIGTQQRSGQHFKDAKQFIDEGNLGHVGFARAWMSYGRPFVKKVPDTDPPAGFDYNLWLGPAPFHPYNEEKVHYNWHFFYDFGTGDAGNWGAHWLDIARWYLSADVPSQCAAQGGQFVVDDEKEWPDTQTALFRFPGLKATVVWELRQWSGYGVSGRSRGTGCEFGGDKGTLVIDRGGWEFYPRDRNQAPQRHGSSPMDEPHVKNFADCVRGQAKPAASINEGHKTAILCHLANISTRVGRFVQFDPDKQVVVDDPEAASYARREYRAPWKMPPVA